MPYSRRKLRYSQVAEALVTIVQGSKKKVNETEGSQQMEFDSLEITLSSALINAPIQTLPFVTEIPLFTSLFQPGALRGLSLFGATGAARLVRTSDSRLSSDSVRALELSQAQT